jgi:hypothetical protein
MMRKAEIVDIERGWIPTRKWIAAQVTALVGVILMLVTGDTTVTDPEKVAIGTFVVQAVTTYLVPNQTTPTGVPDTKAVAVAGPEGGVRA